MDNKNDLFAVARQEIHYLPMCPCLECRNERERREKTQLPARDDIGLPANSHVFTLTVESAQIMGYIPPQSPISLAQRLIRESCRGETPLQ